MIRLRKADIYMDVSRKEMIMTTVLFTNQIYSERYSYSYAVLKEKEQSFDVVRSYKVKNGNYIVVDIGS
ncbi:MAG: hypothetical protein IJD40_11820 [Lachnospiraceae bacterium]|nr:hypothetical protein [Lachnospiraceae bacterium]